MLISAISDQLYSILPQSKLIIKEKGRSSETHLAYWTSWSIINGSEDYDSSL